MNASFYYISEAEIYKAINHTELFAGIGDSERHMLASKLFVIQSPANEIIIEQGDISDSLYMIFKGHVAVYIKKTEAGFESIVWGLVRYLGKLGCCARYEELLE